jgi:hypothetical protein
MKEYRCFVDIALTSEASIKRTRKNQRLGIFLKKGDKSDSDIDVRTFIGDMYNTCPYSLEVVC